MRLERPSDREGSIKQLRAQLQSLIRELDRTTEQIQLLEIQGDLDKASSRSRLPGEFSDLIRKQNKISHEIIALKRKIQHLSARTILKAEIIVLPILAILLFYGIENQSMANPSDKIDPMKTRYLIENLQGSPDPTYKYWNVVRGSQLSVSIINSDHLSEEKIDAVKEAITSKKPVYVNNSLLGKSPSDGKSEYYLGWAGALMTINNTEYAVPNQFNVVESTTGPGQIVIILSNLEDPDGYSGYTRSVVDNSQILKSFITIYGADKLSAGELTAIVRHEFGHALGLPHSTNPTDLMSPTITTSYPYISECDVNTIRDLYNNHPENMNCNSS